MNMLFTKYALGVEVVDIPINSVFFNDNATTIDNIALFGQFHLRPRPHFC